MALPRRSPGATRRAPFGNLLVNKDREHSRAITIRFADAEPQSDRYFVGDVTRVTFGAEKYQWRPNGPHGLADPDGPQVKSTVSGGKGATYSLPKASITVMHGRIGSIPDEFTSPSSAHSAYPRWKIGHGPMDQDARGWSRVEHFL